MVLAGLGVLVVPLLVVDGDPHFLWIAVVQALGALVVVGAVEVLRIPHVGIVVKPLPVLRIVAVAPLTAIGLLRVGLCGGASRSTAPARKAVPASSGETLVRPPKAKA